MRAQLVELEGDDRTRVQLSMDVVRLKAEAARLRSAGGAGAEELQRQVREFALTTQAELEKENASLHARATLAEEEAASTRRYWAQASVAYQREIARLRAVVGRYDASALNGDIKDALAIAGMPADY